MKPFKNIIYFFLSLQEKWLLRNLRNTIGIKYNSNRKKYYGDGYFLSLDTIAETEKNKIEDLIRLTLKNANYEPENLLDYIKKQGTPIYYINNNKYLNSIGENEGFIYPQNGAKAIYISLLTDNKFSLKTPEMFILTKGEINKYYFIYHFYNWFCFKQKIKGMDLESQNLLKKYLFNANDEDFKNIQLADIYKLKDAIKQDKYAIEFVFKLCQQYEGAKKALGNLKNNGTKI